MYDFSSSDESGGLVMGSQNQGSPLESSRPSILSFNNFQNKQNKNKKEGKQRIAEPNQNVIGSPTKASAKVARSMKAPKNKKLPKPSKDSKTVQANASKLPKSSKLLKSPKKIKAEPKGDLKLRLSIGGGSVPSMEQGPESGDISSIIEFVASGGGGERFLDDEPLEPPIQSKKSRPPAAGRGVVGNSPKKSKKKKLPTDSHNINQAATARAAALADEVIAAVAAEVEVEGSMSDDDEDPSVADPHRLTVVIPGENEADVDAITGSPQHEQDAIQGMLSMSGTFPFARNDGSGGDARRSRTSGNIERLKARLAAKRGLLPPGQTKGEGRQQEEEDEFEKALRNCRQDNDFIYLGIDANDDDWRSLKKRNRGTIKQGADQTWSPKGVSLKGLPREAQRPQREGVKREIMESTLAESTKYDPTATSAPTTKPVKASKAKGAPREKKEQSKVPVERGESISKISSESKVRRPGKKGMATAKQRLGKILKIHKMYH